MAAAINTSAALLMSLEEKSLNMANTFLVSGDKYTNHTCADERSQGNPLTLAGQPDREALFSTRPVDSHPD